MKFSRRETLRGGTAAVAAIAASGAVAGIAISSAVSEPLLELWREHQMQRSEERRIEAEIDARFEAGDLKSLRALEDRSNTISAGLFNGLENKIANSRARTLAGCIVQAKLLFEYTDAGEGGHWVGGQDVTLAQNLLAGLECLAGEVLS